MNPHTELALVGEVRPSVNELLDRANREHHLVEESLGRALEHVIRSGEALAEARSAIEFKGWRAWVEENFDGGHVVASYYMRIAEHRDLVAGLPNVRQAMQRLRGMPALRRPGYEGYGDDVKEEVRALVSTGMSPAEVARIMGVCATTVRCWTDPEVLRRHRERVRQQSAARRQRRREEKQQALNRKAERAARKAGGALAESYSLAHRLEDQLAAAERAATDPEAKAALDEAIGFQHRLKDRVIRALGVQP